jgi:dTDP-4-amino-4,6-dideoxygalactose transaminase
MQLSGTSDVVENYEKKLSLFFGSRYAVALSSGSAALHTALYLSGVVEDTEVLVPATAPIPSILPILTSNARPVFVDTEPIGFSIDPTDLRKKITSKTKALLSVPLWGYPVSYDEIYGTLIENNIMLIEDAAQAHATIIKNRFAGTCGKIGCFSTHDRKILATGEGGFILTDDESIYKCAKQFSQLGYMNGLDYGVNYKLSTLQSALGIYRLDHVNKSLAERKLNAQTIINHLNKDFIQELPYPNGSQPNYYSLVVTTHKKHDFDFNKFTRYLFEHGIPSDVIRYKYDVAYHYPLFSKYGRGKCLNAENTVKSITTIPVHPGLSPDNISYICDILKHINFDDFVVNYSNPVT